MFEENVAESNSADWKLSKLGHNKMRSRVDLHGRSPLVSFIRIIVLIITTSISNAP